MKRQSAVWLVMCIFFTGSISFAQDQKIEAYRLSISDIKTTNLIFPYAIKSVDRGSKDVLVQKAHDVENVLQVKAAVEGFPETNLTVMTSDGKFYSYLLKYHSQPSYLNLRVALSGNSNESVIIFNPEGTTDKVQQAAQTVIHKRQFINSTESRNFKVHLSLKGIYIQDDMLYFQIGLKNNSWVDYPIRQLRLFVRDKKKGKRTTTQEIELTPIYTLGNTKVITNRSEHTVVYAVKSFTIPPSKKLLFQMQESNGGRHLDLNIINKQIVKAWRVF
ncbi:conjugative transposon protein TraN [Niabella sp. 22666]|uniref:conjugative transposon protein TraN n=1 Tax=Niabella sp. 22666 TaxID=3453954 RepID=UPI003F87E7DF